MQAQNTFQNNTLQQQGALPLQKAGLPQNSQGNLLQGQQGLPLQQSGLPLQQGLSQQQGGLSFQQGSLPLQQSGLSLQQGGLPLQQGLSLQQQGGFPLQNSGGNVPLQNTGLQFQNSALLQQQSVPIVRTTTFEPIVQTITRAPIVQQTTRIDRVTQIQPIIHREIEATEVRLIEKHIYESVPISGPSMVTHQPIIQETIVPKVIEEIQPVLHRDVPAPYFERVEEHITERVVQPTITSKQLFSENVVLGLEEATSRGLVIPQAAPAPIQEPLVRSTTATALVQNVVRPAIVEQIARPERVVQVQPVIHREIEAPEVHIIEKHLYEQVPSTGPSVITKQAIVEESIRPTIIEEIQPVIHREVSQVQLERVEQHTTEYVQQPAVETKEVISESRVLPAQALPLPTQQRSANAVVNTTTAPVQLQTVQRATLVEETARPERVVQVQPIIHREVEAPEVRVIEKHLYETVPSVGPSLITKQAIVEETVVPTIVEEIQPVVHRSVPAPFVERVEEHVTEYVLQDTITTKQVINDTSLTSLAAPTAGFAAGGPLPQQTIAPTQLPAGRRL